MQTPHISAYTLKTLVQKLRPNRFPGMSSLMAALVGYVLGAKFVDPAITEIVVTADGFVLARAAGEIGPKRFIGKYTDLRRNWLSLIAAAELTQKEYMEAQCLFAANSLF